MSSRKPIRKAVFPVAGLGTRFLPAAKALPREMLVLVDRPVIQYGVEEATRSGIEQIVLVTSRGKGIIEDHFDVLQIPIGKLLRFEQLGGWKPLKKLELDVTKIDFVVHGSPPRAM